MIVLHSQDHRIIKAVTELASPARVEVVTPKAREIVKADAIVTFGEITPKLSLLGMRVGTTMIYVLPEAGEYLHKAMREGKVTSIAGADLNKYERLF